MVSADENRTPQRPQRAAILTGCAGLTVVGMHWFETPSELSGGANGSILRRYLEDSLDLIGRGVMAQTVAFGALVLFVVGLHSLVRDAEFPGRLLSDLAGLSGALVAVWFWLSGALAAIPLVLADDDGSLAGYSNQVLLSLDPLDRLGQTFGALATVPRGLLVLAVSILAVRTRFLARWVGYVGLAVAVVSLGAVVVAPFSLVGPLAFMVWILLVSAFLLVRAVQDRRRAVAVRPTESVLGGQWHREAAP
jgi:hypothetical protein